jgi:CheY-like chemotaxis protein
LVELTVERALDGPRGDSGEGAMLRLLGSLHEVAADEAAVSASTRSRREAVGSGGARPDGDGRGRDGAGGLLLTLRQALGGLTEEERPVVLLVGLEGLRYEQVANVLELPVEVVRTRLAGGRERLRRLTGVAPRRPRVLVVEDEAVTALEMRGLLAAMGLEVSGVAATAADALVKAAAVRPDLALVDVRLGGGEDGVEIAREMAERFGAPALFVTAFPEELTRAEGFSSCGHLPKPYAPDEFRAAVEAALRRGVGAGRAA